MQDSVQVFPIENLSVFFIFCLTDVLLLRSWRMFLLFDEPYLGDLFINQLNISLHILQKNHTCKNTMFICICQCIYIRNMFCSDIVNIPRRIHSPIITSDPENHTGEGILFSSRMFDSFAIISRELSFVGNTGSQDWGYFRIQIMI